MRKFFKRCASLLALTSFVFAGYSTAKAVDVDFGVEYTVEKGQAFDGSFILLEPTTISVQTDLSGDLYKGNTMIDCDDTKWGVPTTYIFTNLAAGTYTYKIDGGFNFSGGMVKFIKGNGDEETGGGDSGNSPGEGGDHLQLPVNGDATVTLLWGNTDRWYYTPTQNGVLTCTVTNGIIPTTASYLFTEAGVAVSPFSTEKDAYDPDGFFHIAKWNLEAGKTYFFTNGANEDGKICKFTFGDGSGENPGGGGGDEPDPGPGGDASAYSPVELNKTYNVANGETLAVYFTATSNGTLKISQWGTSEKYLFTVPSENLDDFDHYAEGSYMMEGEEPNEYFVFTFEMTAGTTYYYYGKHDAAAYLDLSKVLFEFDGAGGGGDDNPGGYVPEGWDAMQMNQRYTTGSVGAVKLAFTPTKSGKLIATQTGTYDSHLFSAEPKYDATYGYDNNYDILIPAEYEAETSATVHPLEYGVAAGVTYYFVAKLMSGDAISAVEFSFEEITGGNEIQLNTPYMVSSSEGLYTFTSDKSGVLSVQWSNPLNPNEPCYNTGIVWGAQQYFFYEDPGLTQPVGMLSQGDGNGGWLVAFGVEEGKTYYFHAPLNIRYQVVFSFEDVDVEPSVVVVNPTPGGAYNVVDYRYYMSVLTAPATSTVERVTLTYVPKGQSQATTIEMSGAPELFGELQIPVDDLVSRIENGSIEPETDITITLYGLKAGGEYVTKNALVNGDDYVTIGENGLVTITYINGTPIALLNADFPSPFRRAWERGNKEGMATLTFDQEIFVVGDVTVTAGRHYYGSEGGGENVYSQTLPHQNVSWEGNTVTLDFTGINWNMPAGTSEVTIMVSGPIGINKLPASYDGIPVLQEYLPFTTEGSAEIEEPIINTIEPFDGAKFGGLVEDETILIDLIDGIRETAFNVEGVLTDIEGNEYGTYEFFDIPGKKWLYEIIDDVVFYEEMTYLFTVTAWNEEGTKLGSQVVYWYGSTPRGEQPDPDDIWYVRCNVNNFNPNGEAQWALLPSENEDENGIYTGKVTLTEDFQFNLLNPYGNVFIPMNLQTYEPENVTVEFADNAYYGNTDMAYDESEEAYVWTVAGYAGVELTIKLDLNDAYITLTLPDGSGVQINMADGSAVYFDLQGRKVVNPDKGIYIKVQDGKAVKVVK